MINLRTTSASVIDVARMSSATLCLLLASSLVDQVFTGN
jgi:hypothetical protein